MSEAEFQSLLRKQQDEQLARSGMAEGWTETSRLAGGDLALPQGLLDDLRSLDTAPRKQQHALAAAGKGASFAQRKKAMIEELN